MSRNRSKRTSKKKPGDKLYAFVQEGAKKSTEANQTLDAAAESVQTWCNEFKLGTKRVYDDLSAESRRKRPRMQTVASPLHKVSNDSSKTSSNQQEPTVPAVVGKEKVISWPCTGSTTRLELFLKDFVRRSAKKKATKEAREKAVEDARVAEEAKRAEEAKKEAKKKS